MGAFFPLPHMKNMSFLTSFTLKSICFSENSSVWYIHWVPTNSICCRSIVEFLTEPQEPQTPDYSSQNHSISVFSCCQHLERRYVHFLSEFGKCMCFSNMARALWRGDVLSFLAGVKKAGLSHWYFSLFHTFHSVYGLCTPFQDLVAQRKMICCGCIQCLVWSLLCENMLALGLQHESSDVLSIKMWLTRFLAQMNFYN